MGILIDSSVLIDLERRGSAIAAAVKGRETERFFISVISASELLHGVHHAKEPAIRAKRLIFVEAILNVFPVLDIDLATARTHAQLWNKLETSGTMIGLHDSWLAATCLTHRLAIVTGNVREFSRVPGLQVEYWA